jgi:CBS domain-containing protein
MLMSTNSGPLEPESDAPESLLAGDVMGPMPRTCSPFSTVTEAVLIFKDESCDAVPVVDAGKPVGLITTRDVALAVVIEPALTQQPVSSIMNRDVLTAPADTPVDQLSKMMVEAEASILFVVDADGLLLGMISANDLKKQVSVGVVTVVIEPEASSR